VIKQGDFMKQFLMITMLVLFLGCQSETDAKTDAKAETSATNIERTKTVNKTFSEPTKTNLEAGANYQAVIETSKGNITVDLFEKDAPISVTNFKQLAEGGFYDGLTFHRVERNFVIQGGDPDGTGRGGPGYTVKAEINGNPHKHVKGALAWARLPDQMNPEQRSSGSQFYITLQPTPFLDNKYTVFGQTTDGIEVTEKIAIGDKINSIKIIKK
jgi:peptidyl-prolyl cis-trans isomerase B (cyclophilin B)